MELDSKVNYGQEFGTNLKKIATKLIDNQNLCKLLINTDKDPLNKTLHPDIEGTMDLFGENIRIVPLTDPQEKTVSSKIVVIYSGSEVLDKNTATESLTLLIYVYVPYKTWTIAGDQLRPFAIMSEIRKSLQNKRINGLGEINYHGFDISSLTDQMGSYVMRFTVNAFS